VGIQPVTRSRSKHQNVARVCLNTVNPTESSCFEVNDSSTTILPADFLCRGQGARDPAPLAARLAEQFRKQNHEVLSAIRVDIGTRYDGSQVSLEVTTGMTIGAVPLRSPTSGRTEFGLVVRPRYEWPGLGAMLGEMGWKIIPHPLALPNLPRSERKVPPWVLSAIVLGRIQALLASLRRGFEMPTIVRTAPHGQVDWQRYATHHLVRGKFLEVPCRFPDLTVDRLLQGAIHFTLRRHLASLQNQRHAGPFVISLITWCTQLLDQVRSAVPLVPTDLQMCAWMQSGLRSASLREGLDAIAWTVEQRGLAGICDAHGLPWSMSMEQFFEAWAECVLRQVARHMGGVVRSGRQRQTLVPIEWDPPYQGSQRFLLPDLVMETASGIVIMDAKYKDHWEDLSFHRWSEIEEMVRERHRADLLQVLAYAGTLDTPRLVACLAYPCRTATWESLYERRRLFHRATVGNGSRTVNVLLTAIPMDARVERVVTPLAIELHRVLGP
jgi:hypothetical protein